MGSSTLKISDALKGIRRICFDTAPFIYFVERHATYLDLVRPIFQMIDKGQLLSFSSSITLTEVLTQPIKVGNAALTTAYRDILIKGHNFTLVPVDTDVAERAAELRARYQLKTPDALQVAVALHAGCDGFLTNDLGLKRVTEVRVLVLDELELDPPQPES